MALIVNSHTNLMCDVQRKSRMEYHMSPYMHPYMNSHLRPHIHDTRFLLRLYEDGVFPGSEPSEVPGVAAVAAEAGSEM